MNSFFIVLICFIPWEGTSLELDGQKKAERGTLTCRAPSEDRDGQGAPEPLGYCVSGDVNINTVNIHIQNWL